MKYDAIVVGGGAMGLSSALALLTSNLRRVLVLEKHTVGHDRAASSDTNKAIRYEYAEDETYSRMVGRSIDLWQALERTTGADLYVNCGVLCWGHGEDSFARKSFVTLSGMGLPVRELSKEELSVCYPQFNADAISYSIYNSEGGFLRAWRCVDALQSSVRALGGEIREESPVVNLLDGREHGVVLSGGEELCADRVVLAPGAWGSTFLPQLGIKVPVTANKQQVVYISGLGPRFSPQAFPVFLNLDHDFYGFPTDENGRLKASIHLPGPVIDPDVPQTPDREFTAYLMSLLTRYIPGTAEGQISGARNCMYAMTPDEDFVISAAPGLDWVTVLAGFSGHGFKFAPLVGRLAAALSLGDEPEFSPAKFSLDRFAARQL